MKFLVIILTFNNEKNVKNVINKCFKYSKHILVINDGSTDNTLKEIKKTRVIYLSNNINRGKGYSLKKGFKYAIKNNFKVIITLDADGQHPPDYIPKFIKEMKKGYDVVIGTRRKIHPMPLSIRIANFILSQLISKLTGKKITDSQSGYRAINVKLLRGLKLEGDGYEMESEILIALGKKENRFKEIIIPTIYNSKVKFIEGVIRFFKILKSCKVYRKILNS